MNHSVLFQKALNLEFLTLEEGLELYKSATTAELIFVADAIRKIKHPENIVTWIIDRNVNYTNVCISGCKFCNFYRGKNHKEAYITTIDEYKEKINYLLEVGGEQLLLQGGLHPDLGIDFYCDLFSELKSLYPQLKLHALGPPEIVHIAGIEGLSYRETLQQLVEAGLDSLPGAGAEILSDRVREQMSKYKCSSAEWLEVMRQAHKLGLVTSATMMFGHLETKEERIQHLVAVRKVQEEKSAESKGFLAFIPWPFQDENTVLKKKFNVSNKVTSDEYLRTIAISRIMLPNINNIQASWLTVGKDVGGLCLHAGANDLGSVMIEENVVSSAGAHYKMSPDEIKNLINENGFIPKRRDQQYRIMVENH